MNEPTHQLFRAIADPIRLRILHLLRNRELCVGDLVTVLGVPQSTASRHLAYLRKTGLIASRKDSYWTFYSIAPPKTELRRQVLKCLDVDVRGLSADAARLKVIQKKGGCCPT